MCRREERRCRQHNVACMETHHTELCIEPSTENVVGHGGSPALAARMGNSGSNVPDMFHTLCVGLPFQMTLLDSVLQVSAKCMKGQPVSNIIPLHIHHVYH